MKESIIENLRAAAQKLGANIDEISLEIPTNPDFGDFSTNLAMTLARDLKKSPMSIAEELLQHFHDDSISRFEIKAPGFINFFVNSINLVQTLNTVVGEADNYGKNDFGANRKVVLEHTNVNPNKALHIGHLRNACLGNATENILEFCGHDVEAEYYVDDTGVQVAVTYLGMKEYQAENTGMIKYDHFAQDIYVRTMDQLEHDTDLQQKQQVIIHQLDQQDGDDVIPAKEMATQIIKSNLSTMHDFGIDYDLMVWESDILRNGFWQSAFEILKNNPNFVLESEGKNAGCWVIKNVLGEDKVIVKSNGVTTYTGKDIAYHFWKYNLLGKDFLYREWPNRLQSKPLWSTAQGGEPLDKFGRADSVVNFIDVRQTLPQQAVKESLRSLGYTDQADKLKHVAYGVVYLTPKTAEALGVDTSENLSRYAMSGRKGIGVLADDLLILVKKKVLEIYPDSAVANEVALAAIKYQMLKYNPMSEIVFDFDQALDFYGNTGPYLQYTYARSMSILRKAADFNKAAASLENYEDINAAEKEVIKSISQFPEIIQSSACECAPHLLCNYLFELSQKFNSFYAKNTVVSGEGENQTDDFRILLTAATAQILKTGLYLLGLPAPEKM
jgi:arginyl-tRNA synthetase